MIKEYLTEEGDFIIATFYKSNVSWYNETKKTKPQVEHMKSFLRRTVDGGWQEVDLAKINNIINQN